MWLAVSTASWVRKWLEKKQNKTRRLPFSLFLWETKCRAVWVTFRGKQDCCCSALLLVSVSLPAKKRGLQGCMTAAFMTLILFFLTQTVRNSYTLNN